MGEGSLREPSFSSRRGTATIVVFEPCGIPRKDSAFPEQRLSLSWVLEDLEECLPGAWDNVLPPPPARSSYSLTVSRLCSFCPALALRLHCLGVASNPLQALHNCAEDNRLLLLVTGFL